jgi:DNA-binding transcriptional MerR regulator
MNLTVGEIAKALGVSTEMIRFYVRQGILKPFKNEENSYWEYSSDDFMRLSDILFYRDLDLSLKDIQSIFDGLDVEKIGTLITERKKDAEKKIRHYQEIFEKLQEWEEGFRDEYGLMGKYKIGPMPPELRKEGFYDEEDHIARYLKSGIKINRRDWIYVSLSFYCNIYDEEIKLRRYLSVNKTQETEEANRTRDVIEESVERCIFTQVSYSDNVIEMAGPLLAYADKEGFELTGEIYGRENTNFFVDGKRLGMYRLYAPIK